MAAPVRYSGKNHVAPQAKVHIVASIDELHLKRLEYGSMDGPPFYDYGNDPKNLFIANGDALFSLEREIFDGSDKPQIISAVNGLGAGVQQQYHKMFGHIDKEAIREILVSTIRFRGIAVADVSVENVRDLVQDVTIAIAGTRSLRAYHAMSPGQLFEISLPSNEIAAREQFDGIPRSKFPLEFRPITSESFAQRAQVHMSHYIESPSQWKALLGPQLPMTSISERLTTVQRNSYGVAGLMMIYRLLQTGVLRQGAQQADLPANLAAAFADHPETSFLVDNRTGLDPTTGAKNYTSELTRGPAPNQEPSHDEFIVRLAAYLGYIPRLNDSSVPYISNFETRDWWELLRVHVDAVQFHNGRNMLFDFGYGVNLPTARNNNVRTRLDDRRRVNPNTVAGLLYTAQIEHYTRALSGIRDFALAQNERIVGRVTKGAEPGQWFEAYVGGR